ncbi:unnamed protein product, partial [Choristocarpus tenellus]
NDILNDAIVTGSSIVLIGSFFWIPGFLWYMWRKKCKTRRQKALLLGCLLAAFTVPMPTTRKLTKLKLWDRFLQYFSGRVVGEAQAGLNQQTLFCLVPHGIFPFGIALGSLGRLNEAVFNNLRPVVATSITRVPIIGHILGLIGAVDASPATVDKALSEGHSLGLAPGGIAEIFLDSKAGKEYALLKNRKGFIKQAMAHGVPIVPVYVFGNSDTFRRVQLPMWLEAASRLLKVSLVLFWGRWGLPVPFKIPLTYAVGKAIEVKKNASPSAEEVDALHTLFCAGLMQLFERHKDECGWQHKHLELI